MTKLQRATTLWMLAGSLCMSTGTFQLLLVPQNNARVDQTDNGCAGSQCGNKTVNTNLPTMEDPLEPLRIFLTEQNRVTMSRLSVLSLRPRAECAQQRGQYAFYCPTPHQDDPQNGWECIRSDELCNGLIDCPNGEDEDPVDCMFYQAMEEQNRHLRRIILDQYSKFNN